MLRLIFMFFLSCCLLATASYAMEQGTPVKRIIYITFDGTRWQDVFLDHRYFQKFWQTYAKDASIYGEPKSNTTMETASVPISLPSYQSQMSGAVQPCNDNNCGQIRVETVAEKILQHFFLNKRDVAIIASWPGIRLANEKISGTTFSNIANVPMYDPDTQQADEVMLKINEQQTADCPPWDNERYDKYTFAQAMHYLQKYQPRFLWISLLDADSAAHGNNLRQYHEALKFYDYVLDTVMTTLKNLNLDRETLVIVTTDHGRGNGDHWTGHGPQLPESKQTWAFVFNGKLKPISQNGNVTKYSTLSIRPTIEEFLGM